MTAIGDDAAPPATGWRGLSARMRSRGARATASDGGGAGALASGGSGGDGAGAVSGLSSERVAAADAAGASAAAAGGGGPGPHGPPPGSGGAGASAGRSSAAGSGAASGAPGAAFRGFGAAADADGVRARRRRGRGINVGGPERIGSVALGLGLLGFGIARRGLLGGAAALVGSALSWRGASGRCPVYRALDVDTESGRTLPDRVEAARGITIGADLEALREVLADPARHAAAAPPGAVEAAGADAARITARLPGLGPRSWEVRREDAPDGGLVWRAGRDAPFPHDLAFRLAPAPGDRGTEVLARLELRAGGPGTRVVLRALRPLVERVLGRHLARLKQLVEAGEIATAGPQPAGPRSALRRGLAALEPKPRPAAQQEASP